MNLFGKPWSLGPQTIGENGHIHMLWRKFVNVNVCVVDILDRYWINKMEN